MEWVVEKVNNINHPNPSTRIARMGPSTMHSRITLTGWFQGCGLNAIESLGLLDSIGAEHWKSFKEKLASLGCSLGQMGGYNPKRWLFTTTNPEGRIGLYAELIKNARKIDQFPNLSHGPHDIHVYILDV